jgi:hypothetical protein
LAEKAAGLFDLIPGYGLSDLEHSNKKEVSRKQAKNAKEYNAVLYWEPGGSA